MKQYPDDNMQQFNNQLQVGQLAMIINTTKPENSELIGKIVTIEMLPALGEEVSHFYHVRKGRVVVEGDGNRAFCSGQTPPHNAPLSDGTPMIDNHVRLKREYLMPLPPLPEEENIEQMDKRLEGVK